MRAGPPDHWVISRSLRHAYRPPITHRPRARRLTVSWRQVRRKRGLADHSTGAMNGRLNVLMVEDEPVNRALLRAVLQRSGVDRLRDCELVETETLAGARESLLAHPIRPSSPPTFASRKGRVLPPPPARPRGDKPRRSGCRSARARPPRSPTGRDAPPQAASVSFLAPTVRTVQLDRWLVWFARPSPWLAAAAGGPPAPPPPPPRARSGHGVEANSLAELGTTVACSRELRGATS